jgi:hypothetical protein
MTKKKSGLLKILRSLKLNLLLREYTEHFQKLQAFISSVPVKPSFGFISKTCLKFHFTKNSCITIGSLFPCRQHLNLIGGCYV